MNNDRARGALLGLAIGDAMGAPTEGMTLHAIRERWGRVRGFVDPEAAGTDDTEYAVLCARGVLRGERTSPPGSSPTPGWRPCARSGPGSTGPASAR
nr:hypothetical protein GCM10025730_12550 [Promicromonospora thailandica]